jgi:hypothetical protein
MLLARDDGGDGDGGGGGGSSTGGRVSHPNRKTVRLDAMMNFTKGRIFILNHHGVVRINIYLMNDKDCN